jgi:hypothetical protein
MKQQINTIRSDIESIATENNNNNNNYIISTNYSTPSNPLFTTNSNHKSHSPNFNKPSIKTKYIHRKNSHSQHYNLLFKTNNNAPLSDYNSANRNETFQNKLPITSNSMYMNHKTNKIYKLNDNMNIRQKKGKSVVMSNKLRDCNDIGLNGNSNDVVKELIDITNKYCEDKNEWEVNKDVITPGFVVENYKRLLKENIMYREFIKNISKLHKNKMGHNSNVPTNTNNNSNTIIELWKWINYMSHNDNSNTYNNNNNNSNKYQQYCEQIMFEHNLQTFNDFTSFINHLLNKSTKNETFLDGIKKLLLVNNKIDTYPQ